MSEERTGKFVLANLFVRSFSFFALLLMIFFLSVAVVFLASHLEDAAPAEFKLLINVLKNRFFR